MREQVSSSTGFDCSANAEPSAAGKKRAVPGLVFFPISFFQTPEVFAKPHMPAELFFSARIKKKKWAVISDKMRGVESTH